MLIVCFFFAYKKLAQFAVRCALPPRRSESPVCATDNKPSCVLHLLGWFIGSRGFSSLERRPEFWVLQNHYIFIFSSQKYTTLSLYVFISSLYAAIVKISSIFIVCSFKVIFAYFDTIIF